MLKDSVAFLAGVYAARLTEAHDGTDVQPVRNPEAGSRYERLCHLLWMCLQIPDFIENGRIEKAMRWLGFIQGSMWVMEIRSIEEMKSDNMPDGAMFDKERV